MIKPVFATILLIFTFSLSFGQFTPVGTAVSNGTCFELTQNADLQVGAVWSNSTIDLSSPFTLSFNMDIGDITSGSDADGVAFVMQQDGVGFIGGEGGNLGYVGNMGNFGVPNNSLGIAFRTYTYDAIEIWANSISDLSGSPYPLPPVSGLHPVTITWDPTSTTLSIDFDNNGIDLLWTNDIITNYFGGNSNIYWGFTGANFVSTPIQSVCDIQMVVLTPIPTMGEWGLILLALLILNFGTMAIIKTNRQPALAMAEKSTGHSILSLDNMPFDGKIYGKILFFSFVTVFSGFAIAIVGFGYSLTNADIPGALVCIPVLSYFLFLLKKED